MTCAPSVADYPEPGEIANNQDTKAQPHPGRSGLRRSQIAPPIMNRQRRRIPAQTASNRKSAIASIRRGPGHPARGRRRRGCACYEDLRHQRNIRNRTAPSPRSAGCARG